MPGSRLANIDLPVPGGPIIKHVVATGGGDLKCALDRLLSLDVGEVRAVDVLHGEQLGEIDLLGLDRLAALEKRGGLAKIRDGVNFQSIDDGGLGGVVAWNHDTVHADRARLEGDGQHAFHAPHGTGQREFSDHQDALELGGLELLAGGEHADADRQIEARALLADVGRGEVDGNAAQRHLEAGVGEGGGDAVA